MFSCGCENAGSDPFLLFPAVIHIKKGNKMVCDCCSNLKQGPTLLTYKITLNKKHK